MNNFFDEMNERIRISSNKRFTERVIYKEKHYRLLFHGLTDNLSSHILSTIMKRKSKWYRIVIERQLGLAYVYAHFFRKCSCDSKNRYAKILHIVVNEAWNEFIKQNGLHMEKD